MAKEDMQIDLFGREIPVSQIQKQKQGGRRETIRDCFRKMHGLIQEHTCGECKYITTFQYGGSRYFKCKKIGISHSSATDIRLKDSACELFEPQGETE